MIFDHVGFGVKDFAASKAFFVEALEPLGIGIIMEGDDWAMMGAKGRPEFWFGALMTAPGPLHLAFKASSHAQVQDFYEKALLFGGVDNGAPGLRKHYHAHYYAAFVIAPDGHNIEAVCHHVEEKN